MSSDDFRDINRGGAAGLSIGVWVAIIIIVMSVLIGGFFMVVEPFVVQHERNVIEQSQTFVQTQREQLLHLVTEWQEAEPDTQAVLETRMRQMADRLQPADVPDEVKVILEEGS